MVTPLSFKGDKKTKKRKRAAADAGDDKSGDGATQLSRARADPDDTAAADDHDDSWVSADAVTDLSGPILFVLPSDPPACLACDVRGAVFASALENLVDGDPRTAEPHDVRQVWIANRIVGTEAFSFKGHHGRYLSCDKFGILSATTEAVSPREAFVPVATADTPGTFQVQTQRDTYVSIHAATKASGLPDVRGDATDVSFSSTLRIRMQARFKPRLRAAKADRAREKITRKELEQAVGRRLEEDEVKRLKRARREGDYHEAILLLRAKQKHDKYT